MNIPAHLEPFIHWAFNCVAQLWYLFIVVVMAAVVVVVAVVVAFCMRLGGGSRCVRWCCRYSLKVKLVNVTLQKEETLPGLEMRLKPMLTSLGATVEVVSSPQLSFVEVMMGGSTWFTKRGSSWCMPSDNLVKPPTVVCRSHDGVADTCRHVDMAVCCDGMERLRPGGHIHASVTVLVRGDGLFF